MDDKSPLTRHLAETGETYFQHMKFTMSVAGQLLLAGMAVVIHGLLPFLFTNTASRMIDRIHARIAARKARSAAV